MQYEIVSFNPATGSSLVRFYTDDFPAGLFYNVDIPLVDGKFISGEELKSHIMAFAPYGQISRAIDVARAEIPDELALLVPKPAQQTEADSDQGQKVQP